MNVPTKDQAESTETLWQLLPVGSVVYTQLVHVSRSGMTRFLRLFVVQDGAPRNITWHVANALGERTADRNGERVLKIGGCGTDMGFEVVYGLGRVLYPAGFAVAGVGRNGDRSGRDTDGGYALKHRWL